MTIRRLPANPILSPRTPGWHPERVGTNFNGPALIRLPETYDARARLGSDGDSPAGGPYRLFFGHHAGHGIRVASAAAVEGPWHIHDRYAIELKDTPFTGHMASPDVHLDPAKRRLIMYLHAHGGVSPSHRNVEQPTLVAESHDGVNWALVHERHLGESYFKAFLGPDETVYAISKGGRLYRAAAWEGPFENVGVVDRSGRHWAAWIDEALDPTIVHLVYSRWGDQPERLLYARVALTGPPAARRIETRSELLRPEFSWEGVEHPIRVSQNGAAEHVHELRDPDFFEDTDGRLYLLYSAAGESCIAIAELDKDRLWNEPAGPS